MSFSNDINERLKQAMRDKNEAALRTLRAIKSAILLEKTSKGGSEELSTEQEMAILNREAKKRRESIDIFEKQGREDLASGEREELAIIDQFLPEQLGADKIRETVARIMAESGQTELSKVMPLVRAELSGKADGKLIAEIVKEALA